jgi:hypothetical protein
MSWHANFVAVENRAEGQFLRDAERRVMFLILRDGTVETNTVNQERNNNNNNNSYFCCLKYEHFYIKIMLVVQRIVYKCDDDYM